jgi:CBS domain-containing protein
MNVEELMNRDPLTIGADVSFSSAYQQLLDLRVRSLPVVDDAGIYKGMFDVYDIWGVLLPKAARLEGRSLRDLAFVSSSEGQLREKLREAGSHRVSEFVDRDLPAIYPDTPLQEAIRLLYEHDGNLAVVNRKTGELLGLLSAWEILARLR